MELTNSTQKHKWFDLFRTPKFRQDCIQGSAVVFGALSLTRVPADIGLTLVSALGQFFLGEKTVSATCRPHDLTALGPEEESLKMEFWSPLLGHAPSPSAVPWAQGRNLRSGQLHSLRGRGRTGHWG